MLIYSRHDPRFFDRRLHKGGSNTTSESNPITTNIDKRIAVQDGIGVSGDGSSVSTNYSTSLTSDSRSFSDSRNYSTWVDNSNSSDAVIAMAKAGADIIKSSGAAVVDLARFQGEQNTSAWNTTVTQGAKLIDNLIDRTADVNALATKVVDSFMPSENKQTEALKYGLIAAAVVAGAVLLNGGKK